MKKLALIVPCAIVLLACTQREQQPPQDPANAVQQATPQEAAPVTAAPERTSVSLEQVVALDSVVLENAEWTRKACSLDRVDDTTGADVEFEANKSGPTLFTGYLIDDQDRPSGDFQVVLKSDSGSFAFPAKTGASRPDVAAYFKVPALIRAGFEVSVDMAGVEPGQYHPVFLLERDGRALFCETGRKLNVGV